MFRKGVSAIIVNKQNQILLVNLESFDEKFFTILGGGIEEESLEDAVYREIEEEAGIKKGSLELVGQCEHPLLTTFKKPRVSKEGKEYVGSERHFFGFRFTGTDEEVCPREGEVRVCKWVSFADLKDYLLFDNQLEDSVEKIIELFPSFKS